MFGSDFFKIIKFVIAILRLIAEIFGNDEDRRSAEENGFGKVV